MPRVVVILKYLIQQNAPLPTSCEPKSLKGIDKQRYVGLSLKQLSFLKYSVSECVSKTSLI